MTLRKPEIPFSYEDYKSLANTSDERYELIDGDLYVVPAPSTTHQFISQNIEFALLRHVRASRAGRVLHAPVDVVLGEGAERSVVQPDILFVSEERANIVTEPEIAGTPDLVIEILSPGTAERDRSQKKTLYARHGVREYWIVDPARKAVYVYLWSAVGYEEPTRYEIRDRLTTPLLEGFQLLVADVFRLSSA